MRGRVNPSKPMGIIEYKNINNSRAVRRGCPAIYLFNNPQSYILNGYYSQKKYGVKIKAFLRISESSEALV